MNEILPTIDRQTIVTLSVKGRYTGKPRPWVVIQSDAFFDTDSVTLCLITQALIDDAPLLRITVNPSDRNGLRMPSQIQVDKIVTVRRSDLHDVVGRLEDGYMQALSDALRFFIAV